VEAKMTERAWDSERVGYADDDDDDEPDSGPLDESEVLDADNLLGTDADSDEIDDSWDAPERSSPATRFGTTTREQREGLSIARSLAQEQPEPDPYAEAERLEEEDADSEYSEGMNELIDHAEGPPAARQAAGRRRPKPPEEDAIRVEWGG
jgi:hypothetical protein